MSPKAQMEIDPDALEMPAEIAFIPRDQRAISPAPTPPGPSTRQDPNTGDTIVIVGRKKEKKRKRTTTLLPEPVAIGDSEIMAVDGVAADTKGKRLTSSSSSSSEEPEPFDYTTVPNLLDAEHPAPAPSTGPVQKKLKTGKEKKKKGVFYQRRFPWRSCF